MNTNTQTIVNEVHKRLSSAYKVNFLPVEEFNEQFAVVSKTFLEQMIPLEKEYKQLCKSRDISAVVVEKSKYILTRFKTGFLPVDLMMQYVEKYKLPENRNERDIVLQNLEKYAQEGIIKLSEQELKNSFPDWHGKYESEYQKEVKRRDWQIFTPLLLYAQKKASFLKQINAHKENGIEKPAQSVEALLKDYLNGFLSIPYHFHYIDRDANLFLDSPQNFLKAFKKKYQEQKSKYQQLLRNSKIFVGKEQLAPFDEYVINIGSITSWEEKTANGMKLRNTFKIYREGHNPYNYKDVNDCEKVESEIVNIFLLKPKGGILVKISIYEGGLLKRTPYYINRHIQQVDLIYNCIVRAHPHKHFDPVTIVFDNSEKAYQFQKKIFDAQEWKRNNYTNGRKPL